MPRYTKAQRDAAAKKNAAREAVGQKRIGRVKKPISWKQFDELCTIQCTQREILAVLDIGDVALNQRGIDERGVPFLELYNQKREAGLKSLRRAQWDNAVKSKNAIMQIWLGKNMLRQSDKVAEPEDDPEAFASKARAALAAMDESVEGPVATAEDAA